MDIFDGSIVLLDGAMGTQFQAMGMSGKDCPEQWALENPDAVKKVLRSYKNAGSCALLSPTFGANPIKLREYGLQDRCAEFNTALMLMSKEAAPDVLIGGDISTTGQHLYPLGDLSFEEAVESYEIQAQALKAGGADYLAIETLMDLQEARAALIGCMTTGLAVVITMTFENGRTITGLDAATAAITLQSLGASAIGCNCGVGPVEMLPSIKAMAAVARIPIIAKPNAGLPMLKDGKTIYPLEPQPFATATLELLKAGASWVGGCCGTTPDHISALADAIKAYPQKTVKPNNQTQYLAWPRGHVEYDPNAKFQFITLSEPEMKKALQSDDYDTILDELTSRGDIYCLEASSAGGDEKSSLIGMMRAIHPYLDRPLAFRASPAALEAALREYPGRAFVFSEKGYAPYGAVLGAL